MARAVAEEITNEFFEKIRQKGKDCVEIAEKINRMIKTEDDYQRSMFEGMKAITTHLQKGGKAKCVSLPLDAGANEIFKDLLREYQVPYVGAKSNRPRNEHIFYRDKDKRIIDICRIELFNRLNLMCSELSPKDFFKKYSNDEIRAIGGLDKGDIEFIRREIGDLNENSKDIDFSVVKDINNEGMEMIIYPKEKEELIKRTVDRVIFDFSGKDGKEKKEEVLKQLDEKHRFENIIFNNVNSGKDVCLVDSINPSIFCLINESGIYLHRLSISDDGKIKDNMVKSENRKELHRFTQEMYKPVLMSLKEVNIIRGINGDGTIDCDSKSFNEKLNILKKKTLILPENRRYKADTFITSLRKPTEQSIKTFVNLPKEFIYTAEEYIRINKLNETEIVDDTLSCTDRDLEQIEKLIRNNLYRKYDTTEITELTPLKEYENKFFYEGRGRINLTDRKLMREKPQYIVDAEDERFVFLLLDGENLKVLDKEKEILKISIDSEDFIDDFTQIINNLKEPLVLQKQELEGKKEDILLSICERRPDIKEYESKDVLRTKMFYRESKEYDEINGKTPENPTDKQKEAMKKIREYRENITVINYSEETKDLYREPDRAVCVKTSKPEIHL